MTLIWTGVGVPTRGVWMPRLTVRFLNLRKTGNVLLGLSRYPGRSQSKLRLTYDLGAITEFTYIEADKYYDPYLVSISEENCQDTFRLEEEIFVVPSQLAIPNVFSPNEDGDQRLFRVQAPIAGKMPGQHHEPKRGSGL